MPTETISVRKGQAEFPVSDLSVDWLTTGTGLIVARGAVNQQHTRCACQIVMSRLRVMDGAPSRAFPGSPAHVLTYPRRVFEAFLL